MNQPSNNGNPLCQNPSSTAVTGASTNVECCADYNYFLGWTMFLCPFKHELNTQYLWETVVWCREQLGNLVGKNPIQKVCVDYNSIKGYDFGDQCTSAHIRHVKTLEKKSF